MLGYYILSIVWVWLIKKNLLTLHSMQPRNQIYMFRSCRYKYLSLQEWFFLLCFLNGEASSRYVEDVLCKAELMKYADDNIRNVDQLLLVKLECLELKEYKEAVISPEDLQSKGFNEKEIEEIENFLSRMTR